MRQISLILVITDQLVPGEREDRIARAHDRVWRPLLEAFDAFPSLRLALHLSGPLGDWMDAEQPGTLDRLAAMVERDQVEIIGGSPAGAALQSLPERDATAHLQGAARWAQSRLGAKVRGAWLGGGGWDGAMPRLLARAGAHYTFCDRGLLETGGRDCDGRAPWYVAEREGAAVGVLPLDPRLPALMPWALPRYVAHELKARALAGERFVTAAVQAEHLGLAHGSRHWCWNGDRAWVPTLLRMLRQQSVWLRTLLPRQAIDGQRPGGRVYPSAGTPGASGVEALPAHLGLVWQRLRRDLDVGVDPNLLRFGRWVVGPPWEAHLARRDEANQLHKRMLRTSAALHRLRRQLKDDRTGRIDPARQQAYDQARGWLYAGQAGGVLHGGPAGGIERPDLRHAAWRALLTAEELVRQALGEADALHHEVIDVDSDGHREVVVSTPFFSTIVRPAMGGALGELGLWRVGNLAACLRRQEESWHEQIAFAAQLPALVEADGRVHGAGLDDEDTDEEELLVDGHEATSSDVHTENLEDVSLPEPPPLPVPDGDLAGALAHDRHHRLLFQEHFLGPGARLESLRRDMHPQEGDFLDEPFALMSAERREGDEILVALSREGVVVCDGVQRLVRVLKRYTFRKDTPTIEVAYEVANRYREPVRSRFAVELNFGLDGEGERTRFLQAGDRHALLDQDGTWERCGELSLVMIDQGLRLRVQCSEPAQLYFYRLRSVVRTCEGYHEEVQGTCLLLAWDLDLWGEEKRRFDLVLGVEGIDAAGPTRAAGH